MKLDPEIVERLLMDRSLGQLDQDVETLLDTFISADPALQRLAGEIGSTVSLARRTFDEKNRPEEATLPPWHGLVPPKSRRLGLLRSYLRSVCWPRPAWP